MNVTKTLMDNFDREVNSYLTSGKHISKSSLRDMKTIVAELLDQRALTRFPGRSYSYSGIKASILAGFDLQNMYK